MTGYHNCGAGRSMAAAGAARRSVAASCIALLLCAPMLLATWTAPQVARAQAPAAVQTQAPAPAVPSELGFIEWLYEQGQDFRAETEALAWLHVHEGRDAQQRTAVEVLRAKLYYRQGRLPEAELMLRSVMDRAPPGPAAQEARELLAYTVLRQGRPAEAQALLGPVRLAPLPNLNAPPPREYDPGRAVAWSTAIPGAGFFTLGEPALGATALGLNVAMIAGAVLSYQQGNTPAALLFLIVELALYQGGRDSVRGEALRLTQRWHDQQYLQWFDAAGEPQLLRVGMTVNF